LRGAEAARVVPQNNFRDFFDGKWEVDVRPNSDPSANGSVTKGMYLMTKSGDRLTGI